MASPNNVVPNPGGAPGAGGTTTTTTPNAEPAATPIPGTAPGGGQAPKKYEYTEDRTDWVPRHRLNDESGKRTTAEQRAQQLEQQLEAERRRIRALADIDPQDPKAAEAAEVEGVLRQFLNKLIPNFEELTKLKPGQLAEALAASQHASSAAEQYYDRHRDQMFGFAETEAAKQLGVEKLTDKQVRQVRNALADEYRAAMAEREQLEADGRAVNENDFVGRYLRGDQSLITEFVKTFLADWVDSARRQVTQSVVRRQGRPVPSGGRGEPLTSKNIADADVSTEDGFKKAIIAARNAG